MIAVLPGRGAEQAVATAQKFYAAQDLDAAWHAIADAARHAPDDPLVAFMHAQFAYESWRDSTDLFERAVRLNPGNQDLVRNFILALISEGEGDRAERLLLALIDRNPGWQEGHATLATLRITRGEGDPCRSYGPACNAQPGNLALHLAWFHRLATGHDWSRAEAALKLAEARFATAAGVRLARAYLACETGVAQAERVFAGLEGIDDPGFDLLRVRQFLRQGDPARALQLAERRLATGDAAQFWPYCNLAWRMIGDERSRWLEGDPGFSSAVDMEFAAAELERLAAFLRSLHKMDAPYPEQSVRGGTQTDRNLLLHHDPIITAVRRRIAAAVEAWRDALPEGGAGHPLLDRKPDLIRFSGSWSARLSGGGYHSAHTHPRGWASSALYVSVPDDMGPAHAGDLAIGLAPPELGLGLAPGRYFRPRPGMLVLFPSTSWHGTIPFEGNERMTIAFDVAPNPAHGGEVL